MHRNCAQLEVLNIGSCVSLDYDKVVRAIAEHLRFDTLGSGD